MDLYEILELKPNASEIDIKKAYYRLAKKFHPDKNKNDYQASIKFQRINTAYEILINPSTRQEYQKMNDNEQTNFIEILEKIINNTIDINEIKKYGINLDKNDFDYLQTNFIKFFQSININELFKIFKGIVPKKDLVMFDCSESDNDIFDELNAEYYYNLPIYMQKINNNDIKLELDIKLSDIANKNKRKIKIKRNINNEMIITTFVFNLFSPYIVYIGGGDCINDNSGNLIIKLKLPNNLYWDDKLLLISQDMTLYEMIYGLNINLDIDEDKKINIKNWVPSRDGFLIDISNMDTTIKITNVNIGIKLSLNYKDSPEKERLLKDFFS